MIKSLPKIFLLFLFFSCASEKENFVFILVDDLGWKDLGYAGSDFYETPNIDKLSRGSVQFINGYSAGSVCSPSRASIMSGKHPARVNITDWIPGDDPKNRRLVGPADRNELALQENTLAEILRENGYQTFFAGKWHLGSEGYYPEDQGFDINKGGHEKGSPPGGYYTPYKNPKLKDGPDGEYLTDRLTTESIYFLNNRDNKPFFLFLSFYTVHTPIQPNKEYVEKFRQKLKMFQDSVATQKVEGESLTTLLQRNPAYASMVYAMDKNVGRLIDELKEKGLYENTTIIFTSDNGGLSTLRKEYTRAAPTSVAPLRGGKGWLYEGGIRVPVLIKPANYDGKQRVKSEVITSYDFFPTILNRVGVKANDADIDGIDLNPLLGDGLTIEREAIFWHYPHYHTSGWTPGAAIRQGNWKLIYFYEKEKTELYDLSTDISESTDVSAEYPEIVSSLMNKLLELQNDVNANKATSNSNYNLE